LPLLKDFNVQTQHNNNNFKTLVLDLREELDVIWSDQFNRTKRKAIRKAEKEMVSVSVLDGFDDNTYLGYKESCKKVGLNVLQQSFFIDLFAESKNIGFKIFSADRNDENLAKRVIIFDKNYAIDWLYWSNHKSGTRANMGQCELLYWEAIKTMKEIGCKYFDLCYIEKERLPHIYKFKSGFCKNEIDVPCVVKKSVTFKITNKLCKIFKKMNNIKKYIPSAIKSITWQYYLRQKHGQHNQIGKRVVMSKDLICGRNCVVGDDVKFGREVILGNSVKIGGNSFVEKAEIGDNSCIEGRVIFTGHGKGYIKIGKESYIGIYNVLDWSNDIVIGDYVHIAGPSTGIWTHSSARTCLNSISLNDKSENFRPTAPINIENNVWIGGNCTIYPGVRIGHHSIIAPNSAVTKTVAPYSMVGGVPARLLKKIESNF